MTPGPLLLFAFVTLATGVVVGSRLSRTWLALTVTGTVAGLSAALMVLFGGGGLGMAERDSRWAANRCICGSMA